MCESMWGYVSRIVGALRGQKKTMDTLNLEVQVAVSLQMWVLGTDPRFSATAISALKC